MKQLFNLRLSAILWIWLIGLSVSLPVKAQFDEPSRNQWFVDASFGLGDANMPELSYDEFIGGETFSGFTDADMVYKFGLSFGLNRRLFHNFYAGARLGYKYAEYQSYGRVSRRNYGSTEYFNIKLTHHVLNLPIEFGYNHTYSHRSGLNIYASVQPGFSVGGGCTYGSERNVRAKNFSFSNPGLCLDCSAGLRYFIRHVSIGAAYHYPLNDAQKTVGSEKIEFSLGYRF